jgi:hemerythrin-like domain-containing protein
MTSISSPTSPAATAMDAPIANFSQCHDGIIDHLQALDELRALLAPAARARKLAADTLMFFDAVIIDHHAEEEGVLFPAVLASAVAGTERPNVMGIVDRLTREHRLVEALWAQLKPGLRQVAKGHDAHVDEAKLQEMVQTYLGHARFEEACFLPLAQTILARNANHMEALDLSLHIRHMRPVMAHI